MNKLTTLLLLVLLLAAGLLVKWQLEREQEQTIAQTTDRLFEGLEVDRIEEILVDHLELAYNVDLKRGDQGNWHIADPIHYPADMGTIGILMQAFEYNTALPLLHEAPNPRELGLDPPRAEIEVVEQRAEGGPRSWKLEVGNVDFDGQHLFVRLDGRLARTARNIDNTLNQGFNSFRSQRALQIRATDIIELHRSGSYQETPRSEPVDLELHAYLDGGVWHSVLPRRMQLDPVLFQVLSIGAGSLRVERFIDDNPASLEPFGLDVPSFRIGLGMGQEEKALLFGRPERGSHWYMKAEDRPNVWRIGERDLARLVLPLEDFLDRNLLRVDRREITEIRLGRPQGDLWLRQSDGGWVVSEVLRSSGEGPLASADPDRVKDILTHLEQAEIQSFREEREGDLAGARRLVVRAGGQVFIGKLGEAVALDDGGQAVPYRREGDELVGLADPWLARLFAFELEDLKNRQLLSIDEVQVVGLALSSDGKTVRFDRSDRGRWTREGSEEEALDLLKVMDALLFLRAGAMAPLEEGGDLSSPVEGRFLMRDGSERSFKVGVTTGADGKVGDACEVDGVRGMLKLKGLRARLEGIVHAQ